MPNVSSVVLRARGAHMAEHLLSKLLPRSTCRNSTASFSGGEGPWKCSHMLEMIRLAGCDTLDKALVLFVEMCHLLPTPTCGGHSTVWDIISEAWGIMYPAAAAPHWVGQRGEPLGSFSTHVTELPGKRQQYHIVKNQWSLIPQSWAHAEVYPENFYNQVTLRARESHWLSKDLKTVLEIILKSLQELMGIFRSRCRGCCPNTKF